MAPAGAGAVVDGEAAAAFPQPEQIRRRRRSAISQTTPSSAKRTPRTQAP